MVTRLVSILFIIWARANIQLVCLLMLSALLAYDLPLHSIRKYSLFLLPPTSLMSTPCPCRSETLVFSLCQFPLGLDKMKLVTNSTTFSSSKIIFSIKNILPMAVKKVTCYGLMPTNRGPKRYFLKLYSDIIFL